MSQHKSESNRTVMERPIRKKKGHKSPQEKGKISSSSSVNSLSSVSSSTTVRSPPAVDPILSPIDVAMATAIQTEQLCSHPSISLVVDQREEEMVRRSVDSVEIPQQVSDFLSHQKKVPLQQIIEELTDNAQKLEWVYSYYKQIQSYLFTGNIFPYENADIGFQEFRSCYERMLELINAYRKLIPSAETPEGLPHRFIYYENAFSNYLDYIEYWEYLQSFEKTWDDFCEKLERHESSYPVLYDSSHPIDLSYLMTDLQEWASEQAQNEINATFPYFVYYMDIEHQNLCKQFSDLLCSYEKISTFTQDFQEKTGALKMQMEEKSEKLMMRIARLRRLVFQAPYWEIYTKKLDNLFKELSETECRIQEYSDLMYKHQEDRSQNFLLLLFEKERLASLKQQLSAYRFLLEEHSKTFVQYVPFVRWLISFFHFRTARAYQLFVQCDQSITKIHGLQQAISIYERDRTLNIDNKTSLTRQLRQRVQFDRTSGQTFFVDGLVRYSLNEVTPKDVVGSFFHGLKQGQTS